MVHLEAEDAAVAALESQKDGEKNEEECELTKSKHSALESQKD